MEPKTLTTIEEIEAAHPGCRLSFGSSEWFGDQLVREVTVWVTSSTTSKLLQPEPGEKCPKMSQHRYVANYWISGR